MIKAVIFDMDGVLIDSEPLWQEAEKMVFATVGIQVTSEMCMETMGLRTEKVVKHTLEKLNVKSNETIAFEDSWNGLLAAKAAGLRTVALPEKSVWHESKYDIADFKLKSLLNFSEKHLQALS